MVTVNDLNIVTIVNYNVIIVIIVILSISIIMIFILNNTILIIIINQGNIYHASYRTEDSNTQQEIHDWFRSHGNVKWVGKGVDLARG